MSFRRRESFTKGTRESIRCNFNLLRLHNGMIAKLQGPVGKIYFLWFITSY